MLMRDRLYKSISYSDININEKILVLINKTDYSGSYGMTMCIALNGEQYE